MSEPASPQLEATLEALARDFDPARLPELPLSAHPALAQRLLASGQAAALARHLGLFVDLDAAVLLALFAHGFPAEAGRALTSFKDLDAACARKLAHAGYAREVLAHLDRFQLLDRGTLEYLDRK